ncbi:MULTISPECIES: STAS domain-containing protein [Actinomadura]|uniref:STAS domain-containing protein n=1 Tax=Actinomadura yumaensis TaxID=111807 RepID=A0ABW2CLC0_9ACTN|nr:STAS domain-containing protein [Actinomadura sp. J1-007]MWK36594.1 STAS domain-containing protein [Actinomadura sp. J1-007]
MGGLQLQPLTELVGVRAVGEVNITNRTAWEGTLAELPSTPSDPPVVHLELAELTSVDAGGAAAVAAVAQRLAPEGRVVLHDPPRALTRILEVLWPGTAGIEVSSS